MGVFHVFKIVQIVSNCATHHIFSWLFLLLVKIDTATFEVNMTNHSQDITKKQFQQQLTVLPHYGAISIWKKNISHSF